MRANAEDFQAIGQSLLSDDTAQQVAAPTMSPGGPLSQELAAALQAKATEATEFLQSVRQGMTQAGNALVALGAGLRGVDQDGADAITSSGSADG